MMWLTVHRAYALSRHVFAGTKYFVRARLDDLRWCLPSRLPRGDDWIVVNMYASCDAEKGYRRWPCASDRFAIVPHAHAEAVFDLWRVWRRVACDRTCSADGFPLRRTRRCFGEVVWNGWLHQMPSPGLSLHTVPSSNDGLVRYMNATHGRPGFAPTFKKSSRPLVAYDELVRRSVRAERPSSACRAVERVPKVRVGRG